MGNQDFVGLGNNEFHGLPFLTFKVNRDAHHHPHIHRKNSRFHDLSGKLLTASGSP